MSDIEITIASINVKKQDTTATGGVSGGGTTTVNTTPSGPAGGDLQGTYPSPGLAGTIDSSVQFTAAQLLDNSIYQGQAIQDDYIASSNLWSAAYNDSITAVGFATGTGVLTLTQRDASVLTVDLDGRYRTDPQFITFDAINNNISLSDSAVNINLDSVYLAAAANISQLTNDSGYITSASLSPVATSGDYTDLINTPLEVTSTEKTNWNAAYNDSITAVGFATGTGVLTLTQRDASVLTVDLDGRYRTDPQFITFDAINNNISLSDSAVNINLDTVYLAAGANISELTNDSGYITSASLSPVATSGDYTDLINTPSNLAYTNVDNNFTTTQTISGSIDLISGGDRQVSIGSSTNYSYQLKTAGDNFQLLEAGSHTILQYTYGGSLGSGTLNLYNNLSVSGNVSATTLNGINPSLFRTAAQELSFNSGNGELTIFDGNTVDLDSRYLPTSGTIDADTLSGRSIGTFYGTGVGQIALPVTLAYVNQDNSFTTSQTISGNVTATSFFGSGANLTGVAKTGVDNFFTTNQTIDANISMNSAHLDWWSSANAIQIQHASISGGTNSSYGVQITTNAYFNGFNWKRIVVGEAANYYQLAGVHVWRTAPTGSADGIVTYTEQMRITSSGVSIGGIATPLAKLDINGAIRTQAPSGKTAQNWKFGGTNIEPVSLDTSRGLWVEVNGSVYMLAIAQAAGPS